MIKRARKDPAIIPSREYRRIAEKNIRKDRRLLEKLASETGVEVKGPFSGRKSQGKNGNGRISVKRAK